MKKYLNLVAMPDKDAGGVSEEMPADSGVPVEGMPAQGAGDASGAESIEALRAKLEQAELDRRKMQASLQASAAEREKRILAQNKVLEEALKAKMDDKERETYEANLLREQNEALKQELENLRLTSEQRETMQQWVSFFKDTFDVSEEELDLSDPQALIQSGWQAAAESHKRLKGSPPAAKQTSQPAAKRPAAQPVLTGSNGSPSTGPTLTSIQQAQATRLGRPVSMDELFTMAERGEVDLSQVKG